MEAATVAMIIVVIGAILILIEAMNPGAFIVIPGSVLVIVGIIGFKLRLVITGIFHTALLHDVVYITRDVFYFP